VADVYQPLSDSQWQVITDGDLLPGLHRKRTLDLRLVLEAIWHLCRTGSQWRTLPDRYPPWSAVYYYFRRWQQDDTWQRLNTALNQADRLREERDANPSLLCVDSQSVKLAPRIFEERGIDGGKKVNGRKRQIAVDSAGRIWCAHVTAANVADSRGGLGLLDWVPRQRLATVLTDAGYRGEFGQALAKIDVRFEVASRPPTAQGFVPLKQRWVVERTFAWMVCYRRLNHDYDYTTASHKAWLLIANCAMCLNRLTKKSLKP
jgi:transposase